MPPFSSILVLIDPDAGAGPALGRAADLARRGGARLTIASALPDDPWYARLRPGSADAHEALARRQQEHLTALAEPLRAEELDVTVRLLRGRAWEQAAAEVSRDGHDLLLKDAATEAGGGFGAADLQVLRAVPCPAWLVRPSADDPARPAEIRAVLAAVDPAPPAEPGGDPLHLRTDDDRTALNLAIVRMAAEVARLEGAALHLAHAWDVPGESLIRGETLLSKDQVDAYVGDIREAQRQALEALVAAGPDAVEPGHVHFARGDAADVIADLTGRLGVGLVVMGTVARTGLPGFLLGNTAETVLRRVSCSVLALKPAATSP